MASAPHFGNIKYNDTGKCLHGSVHDLDHGGLHFVVRWSEWRTTDLRGGCSGVVMLYRHTIDATSYTFGDLRDLLAKATPPRSGDRLAGITADSAEQMVAARMALG